MFTAEISIKPPFSFERMLRRLQTHPDEQFRVDAEAGLMSRALRVGGKPVLVTLQFKGNVDNPLLTISTDEELRSKQREELVRTIRHMFGADVDVEPLYELMTQDKHLRPLAESFRGLRFLLTPDLFQAMVVTIIAQQLNVPFANALTLRLIQLAGDTVTDRDGDHYHVFPTPEAVARLEVEQLRPLQFSQRKAEYIIDFARAVVNEQIELDKLQDMSDEEVIGYLTPLRGIGRWTVECLLMFGLGRPDLLPAADIGLRNGIHLVYGLPDKPDEKEIRRIGETWAPWRSYVSLYIWEALAAAKRGEAPYEHLEQAKKTL
jgi:DNA-3-methyladenine glycosylase II